MAERVNEIAEEARATQIRSVEASETAQITQVGGSAPNLKPIPVIIPPQAKNQLSNGDFGHSVMTANDLPPNTGGDRNEECWKWFSNDAPVLGQVLSTDVTASVVITVISGGAP